MKKNSGILFIIFIIALSSCSPAVQTDTAPDAEFGTYNTYAYLPSGENDEDETIYTKKIINEINQEMQARGYELDNQNPDLLVNVNTMYEEEEAIQKTFPGTYDYYTPGFFTPSPLEPHYFTGFTGIPRITGYGIRGIEYTEGTFVVDVIDADKNQIIWRGWSETPVDPANLDENIRGYVDNIFKEYPVEPINQ